MINKLQLVIVKLFIRQFLINQGKLILPGVWKKEMQQTFLIIVTNLISKIRKTCIMPNLFIGSYFGISVLYIELKWNNWYTRYD